MESSCSPSVPPGFRFHPTDEELVGYYLRKKVASQKIDLDVIRDIDLYRIEPWDLRERCRIGYEEQHEWYFFSHKDKKYPTGTRTNRATIAGFWKATGRDKAVYDKTKLIGMRKTLVFYKGRAPTGQKTDWIMHEYRLESDYNALPQEEGWVVCRAFKKRLSNAGQGNKSSIHGAGGWDSTYFYDMESTSSAVDHHYISRRQPVPRHGHRMSSAAGQGMHSSSSLLCKQEEILHNNDQLPDNSNLIISPSSSNSAAEFSFLHDLPQLESPSLPLIKRLATSSSSPLPADSTSSNGNRCDHSNRYSNNNKEGGGRLEEQVVLMKADSDVMSGSDKVVTDWRALDKFVASQLMSQAQEETTGLLELPPLLLLQTGNSKEEEDHYKFGSSGGFLMSSTASDCDIGICVTTFWREEEKGGEAYC